ncbi:MAG: molybdopterin-dependent oxidoreductase, partial [Porticoccaceae bacterium]|nr:molybdopterin-dependent oxidoreductase [Porticoccaceae bacterium]
MDTSTSTTCPYCGVGCGISVRVKDDRIIAVSGDSSHPANRGKLCIKGTAVHKTLGEHGRLLHPQVDKCTTDWPSAIQTVASRLTEVREKYGPQAIAFYLSGQLLTEDYYVANKLAKGFIGTANVDTNSRLCMSSAVAAHKRAFGADIVPCNYSDLEQAQLLVLVGSNAAWTHPVLYQRMVAAKQKNPDLKVVVIDPRRTATCDIADLHLAARPGADSVIFSGLLNYLAAHNHLDKTYITNHTSGFENAVHSAGHWTLAAVANRVNLDQRQLARFYQWFAQTDKTVTFFSQGINQSAAGTDSGNAIINCHLATGRIGQPGAGPFSITGQPNAMGGREVGGLANMLAAHMDYSPENCATVADFWGSEHVAQAPGLKAVDLFDGVSRGEIRAIWIMGTNPVVSMPDADKVKAALQQCDTVIVSDCVAATDTTATADILLPAMGWGEKSGTVTNSERCISRQRPLLPAPGDARADWWILSRVASAMGYSGFAYQSPRDIFTEHAALSGFRNQGQRLFDISALSDLSADQYDQLQPIRWPVNREHPNGSERLFSDGQFATDDGRARFVAITARLPERRLNKQFPLALNSGRIR